MKIDFTLNRNRGLNLNTMKKFLLIPIFFLVAIFGFGQTEFFKVANGNWNSTGIWSLDGVTPITCSPCVEGVDYPGENDVAYIFDGFVNVISTTRVGYIVVQFDLTNALRRTSIPISARRVIVSGSILSYDVNTDQFLPPTTTVVQPGNIIFEFTGEDPFGLNEGILGTWSDASPFQTVEINQTGATEVRNSSVLPITSDLIILNGQFNNQSGGQLIDLGSSLLTISSGTTFVSNGPIQGDFNDPTSRFNRISINGVLRTTSHVNSVIIDINAGGVLENNFTGGNQAEGWWYQNEAPTTFNVGEGTVRYGANANQNIAALEYGNLEISASTGNRDKTLAEDGNLRVNGNFTIVSSNVNFLSNNLQPIVFRGNVTNNGNWTSNQVVRFEGDANQIINGSLPITFNDQVDVNKTGGDVVVNSTVTAFNMRFNDEFRITSTSFSPGERNMRSDGSMVINGTLVAGAGTSTFTFGGDTEITGSGTASFRHLTINSGATLSPALNDNLIQVTRNFTNNGTFNHNEGEVHFDGGSSTRTLAGSGTTNFWDMRVTGGTLNNNAASVNLLNQLTLGSSTTFDADGTGSGQFTIISTTDRTAYVAAIPSGSTLSGQVNVQRNMAGKSASWNYIGPVVSGRTVADWQVGFPITGSFSGSSLINGQPRNASLYQYVGTEVVDDWNQGWLVHPPTSTDNTLPIVQGRGYSPYIYNDTYFQNTNNSTWTLRGPVPSGSFSFSSLMAHYTTANPEDDGWQLLSNPHPAPVQWDDFVRNADVSATVSVRVSDGNFATKVAGGASVNWPNEPGLIATAQGFWVQTTGGSPSLSAPQSAKRNVDSPTFFGVEQPEMPNVLKMALWMGNHSDETAVYFHDQATLEYDAEYDAFKRKNSTYNFSSLTPTGLNLAINALPFGMQDISIPLMVSDVDPGEYSITFEGIDNFTVENEFYIIDHFKGKKMLITEGLKYDFLVTDDATTFGSSRFEITNRLGEITSTKPLEQDPTQVYPNPVNNFINIKFGSTFAMDNTLEISVTDMQGRIVFEQNADSGKLFSIDASNFPQGVYVVKIKGNKETDVKRVIKK